MKVLLINRSLTRELGQTGLRGALDTAVGLTVLPDPDNTGVGNDKFKLSHPAAGMAFLFVTVHGFKGCMLITMRHGADGVAVVSAMVSADDPEEAARQLKEIINHELKRDR